MNCSPVVSVIIPYYNGLIYIERTIESIINQSFIDFELLILDDGSEVPIEELILSFCDRRIIYIRGNNVGLCNNINRSLQYTKGEYIARLDQDDLAEPKRLEKQVEFLRSNKNVDCIFTRITKFGKMRELGRQTKKSGMREFVEFVPWRDGCQVNSTMMIRKSVLTSLGGYRQEYYPSDDWDLELRLSQSHKMCILEEALVHYRFHALANTYKIFMLMQNTRRWAEDSYKKRTEGKVERSFSTFQTERSFTTRFRHYCKDNSKLHFRIAAGFFLDGHNIKAAIHLIASFLFHPPTYIKRLLSIKRVGQ